MCDFLGLTQKRFASDVRVTETPARYTLADPALVAVLEGARVLVIMGCGLLGTSVARAYRECFPGSATHIVGVDSHAAAMAEASELSVYDHLCSSVSELALNPPEGGLSDAVIGVVATPPAHIAQAVRELSPVCTWVMDVGSIKAPVIEALLASGTAPANFVPCHPMAGSHRQGPASGTAELFDGRWVFVVSPPDGLAQEPVYSQLAHAFWQSLGARTQEIEAQAHDQAVAYTSHLPHLLASAYMAVDDPDPAAAGTGFMEFTRLSKSNPEMWSQVLHANQAAWRPLLTRYIDTLQGLDALIEKGDVQEIMAYLSARRDERFALDVPADEARSLI